MNAISFNTTNVHADSPPGQADERLTRLAVTRAKQGSSAALRFLYLRYAADTHRYVRSIVGDHHEAEDVTQNVFVKLMPTLSSYEPQRAPFGAWLRRVAHNAAVDTVRGRRSTPVGDVQFDLGESEDNVELVESMKQALRRLPTDQRKVLILRHLVGLSPREIAGELDKTESAIHALHHRARGCFRAALEDLDALPVQ
jgi:RNA polymerase sigma-70 factor, ECF subfamily